MVMRTFKTSHSVLLVSWATQLRFMNTYCKVNRIKTALKEKGRWAQEVLICQEF